MFECDDRVVIIFSGVECSMIATLLHGALRLFQVLVHVASSSAECQSSIVVWYNPVAIILVRALSMSWSCVYGTLAATAVEYASSRLRNIVSMGRFVSHGAAQTASFASLSFGPGTPYGDSNVARMSRTYMFAPHPVEPMMPPV